MSGPYGSVLGAKKHKDSVNSEISKLRDLREYLERGATLKEAFQARVFDPLFNVSHLPLFIALLSRKDIKWKALWKIFCKSVQGTCTNFRWIILCRFIAEERMLTLAELKLIGSNPKTFITVVPMVLGKLTIDNLELLASVCNPVNLLHCESDSLIVSIARHLRLALFKKR